MTEIKRFSPLRQRILMGIVLAFFFWELPRLYRSNLIYFVDYYGTMDMLRALAAGCFLTLADWKRDRKLPLLVLGWLIIAATSLLRGLSVLDDTAPTLYAGLEVFFVCYPLAGCLDDEHRKLFLRILLGCWTAAWAALSCVAIFAAINNLQLYNSAMDYIGIDPSAHRLRIWGYYTVAAGYLMCSILLAVLNLTLCRSRIGKLLTGIALVPMCVAMALTDGRTSFISLGVGLGIAACVLLVPRLKAKRWKPLPLAALCLAVLLVVTAGVYKLLPVLTNGVNAVQKAVTASAEEESKTEEAVQATHRTTTRDGVLSGRQYVWKACLDMLKDHPSLLLTGTSEPLLEDMLAEYTKEYTTKLEYPHTHDIYLQILMETGICGLAVALVFLFLFLRDAWNVLFLGDRELWRRLVPVPALAILFCELAECTTKLDLDQMAAPLLLLLIGLTAVEAQRQPIPKKAKKEKQERK